MIPKIKFMDFRKLVNSKQYDRVLYFLAGFGLAGALIACAPVKRHARLVEKYPFVHTQDTVEIRDTVRITVPEIRIDSVFSYKMLLDTVTLEKENLKIKIYRIRDSIYVTAKSDTITLTKEIIKKVPVRYYIEKKHRDWLKILVILAIVAFTLYALFRKRHGIHINLGQNEKQNTPDVDTFS